MHCKIALATATVAEGPADLPAPLMGTLDAETLADLSWTDPALGLVGFGFWPVADEASDAPAGTLTVDAAAKVVRRSVAPVVVVPPEPAATPLTQKQFRDLWTFDERVLCDNPSLNTGLTEMQRAQLTTLMKDLGAATEILLGHPDIIRGVRLVQSFGILSEARADAILAGQPPA